MDKRVPDDGTPLTKERSLAIELKADTLPSVRLVIPNRLFKGPGV